MYEQFAADLIAFLISYKWFWYTLYKVAQAGHKLKKKRSLKAFGIQPPIL